MADRISDAEKSRGSDFSDIRECIESIEVALGENVDPIDNPREFALQKLCNAIILRLNTIIPHSKTG